MRCLSCKYDLRNLAEHRCPECGRAFDPNDPMTFDSRERRRRRFAESEYLFVAGLLAFLAVPLLLVSVTSQDLFSFMAGTVSLIGAVVIFRFYKLFQRARGHS